MQALKEEFKDLTKWWKTTLGAEEVENVKVSNRLASTPCIVVTSKYGWSANMERIMKSQALSSDSKSSYMKGRKTLEINPRHPIIKELKARAAGEPGEDVEVREPFTEIAFGKRKPARRVAASMYSVETQSCPPSG